MDEELVRIPRLYVTEDTGWRDRLIYEHFFIFGCDWYVSEYSPQDRIFFGYTILNGDFQNSEWGNTSFDELREIRVRGVEVDRDLYWRVRKASEVEKIVRGHRRG